MWDGLLGGGPFLRYAWLHALEETGCVRPERGWLPMHIQIRAPSKGKERGETLLLAPAYVKGNSEGEFVFDHAWARFVEERAHLDYYPKLIVAVPFTPASGPRLLMKPGADTEELAAAFVQGLQAICKKVGLSGVHILFPEASQCLSLRDERLGLIERHGLQYHWSNHGYATFEDFLGAFNSKRRNQIRRERRAVEEQGLELQVCSGSDLDSAHIDEIYELYLTTVNKFYWGRQYLNRGFFHQVFDKLGSGLQVVRACSAARNGAQARARWRSPAR
ncbi:MAG: peptidogalycan biosysnthesis protein [Polyangiaceae bacterium]